MRNSESPRHPSFVGREVNFVLLRWLKMTEEFDLSGIPLACDSQSDVDFDSVGDCQMISSNSNSRNNSMNQNMSLESISIYPNQVISTPVGSIGADDTGNYSMSNSHDIHVEEVEHDFQYNNKSHTSIKAGIKENDKEVSSNAQMRVRTQEELRLREFDLLDEVGPYDEKDDGREGKHNFCDDDYEDEDDDDDENTDDDLSEDEIDAMLEERLNMPPKKKPRLMKSDSVERSEVKEETEEDKEYIEIEKTVMVEKVKNHFEVLPDGWITLTHNSGMPLYLHRPTRVCTLSKPYCLGTGSARKHAIPLSAVPCLEYRRAMDEEKKRNSETDKSVLIVNGTEIPNARVETAQENEMSRQLTSEQLTDYCKSLFEFETIRVFRFKSWLARRKFKRQKNDKIQERPTLPKDTKLITCSIKQSNSGGKSGQTREWIMNPNGKSYVCILHEYVQRALKDQPVYTFKELENTATPYLAIVSIGDIQYGTGFGSSKKQAKHDAAKSTLEILIPEMKEKIDQDEKLRGHAGNNRGNTDLSFFDGIRIEDPRVTEFCAKTTEPLPYEILLTCLQRNFGLSQMNIKYETTPLKHCKNEFIMTVGNHTAKVICRNKRDGKQKASQVILQALHPHIPSWGSLLRLYGNTSVKTVKEKKIEEQEITLLQSRGNSHSPNYAILNKLKEEMKKFKAMKSAIRPIGKFIPPDDIELPAECGSDLRNVII
ncbi:hypothetical protein RUM44_006270 [Polyplax serrata]|uniref:DRBM domain-containing protein n=1 Tax=Polyplax serrata TaxID=468196 RepID=A0ABR1AIB9_POLSC